MFKTFLQHAKAVANNEKWKMSFLHLIVLYYVVELYLYSYYVYPFRYIALRTCKDFAWCLIFYHFCKWMFKIYMLWSKSEVWSVLKLANALRLRSVAKVRFTSNKLSKSQAFPEVTRNLWLKIKICLCIEILVTANYWKVVSNCLFFVEFHLFISSKSLNLKCGHMNRNFTLSIHDLQNMLLEWVLYLYSFLYEYSIWLLFVFCHSWSKETKWTFIVFYFCKNSHLFQ